MEEQHPNDPGQAAYRGLYDGNIAWMQTNLPGLKQQGIDPQQEMLYQYDQLNRLVQAQSLRNFSEISGFASRTATPEGFDASYAYDANGNLLTLQRHNAQATLQDDFTYQYAAGTNKLASLIKTVPPETVTYDDITYNTSPLNSDGKVYRSITVQDDVVVNAGQSPFLRANESITLKQNFHAKAGSGFHAKWTDEANYEVNNDDSQFTYDAIGNLIADSGEGTTITWTPYGKPRSVRKTDGTTVNYRYDAAGNRVEKQVVTSDSTYSTRYIRDASGNVLAIYENDSLLEQPIYGSSRLGMYSGETAPGQQQLGHRKYELNSHLGNVQVVVSDRILMEDSDGDGISESKAEVLASYDYYPYGGLMPGRVYNPTESRHTFNGKELDRETGWQDYGMRLYKPSIARFISVDPITRLYPELTPYQFASNTPIQAIDLDGLEAFKVVVPRFGNITKLKVASGYELKEATFGASAMHPIAAFKVGEVERGGTNISTVSGRIARHVAENENMSVGIGTERNAFRHTLWQATISNEFSGEIAEKIGNAHEGVKYRSSIQIDFDEPLIQNADLTDQIVDALNNEIGRKIAKGLGENAGQIDIAREVLKVQRDKGLYTVNTAGDGTLSISRNKISQKQFNTANETLNTLDKNGLNEKDRQELDND